MIRVAWAKGGHFEYFSDWHSLFSDSTVMLDIIRSARKDYIVRIRAEEKPVEWQGGFFHDGWNAAVNRLVHATVSFTQRPERVPTVEVIDGVRIIVDGSPT